MSHEAAKFILKDAIDALKRIEWSSRTENTGRDCCPFCGGQRTGSNCFENQFSSRMCEFGTKCCIVDHGLVGHQRGCEYVRIMVLAGREDLIDEGIHE